MNQSPGIVTSEQPPASPRAAEPGNAIANGDPGFLARIERAQRTATAALLAQRNPDGVWVGELSSSALATATAITALAQVVRAEPSRAAELAPLIARGRGWLVRHQNADGGWGDTAESVSNISTTTLVWSALGMCAGLPSADAVAAADATEVALVARSVAAAERWLGAAAGSLAPCALVAAIERRYGDDRTFSIPILTMAALCGRLGSDGWRHVRQLPFELAALPQRWFGALQLPVVSYALPALIAMGQVRHAKWPTRNPVARALRDRCRAPTLLKLATLQPENGGFLEATPLTSFVVMSLAAMGAADHVVVQRGIGFLAASARADGSWPIDTNLATWLTTLAVNGIGAALASNEGSAVSGWLVAQQFRSVHPYTLAARGGWAWTNLPGAVPDADDTAGAIVALVQLGGRTPDIDDAVRAGVTWLLDLQNRDGGVPTFCRGWGKLPFDRSSPDITAHAIRAWCAARPTMPENLQARIDRALPRALRFLRTAQRPDGSWTPLWFGHQGHAREENPIYGTARVVSALAALPEPRRDAIRELLDRAVRWLIAQQRPDGGWTAAATGPSSLDETGVVVEALALAASQPESENVNDALQRGGNWLCDAVERSAWDRPAPIGLYFAKLWYHERLYPLLFAAAALNRLAAASR